MWASGADWDNKQILEFMFINIYSAGYQLDVPCEDQFEDIRKTTLGKFKTDRREDLKQN